MTARNQYITADTHVLVVGLGKSGQSALSFCRTRGATVSVSESRPREELDQDLVKGLKKEGIYLETGGHTPQLFSSVDLVLVSPGVSLDIEPISAARKAGIPVVGELAIAAQYLKTPVVAVTGTNGKTTVTTMLGDIFTASGRKTFVGGNIGTPLFDYLAGPQEADVAVVEVSSFQLDSAGGKNGFRPDTALLLNISPDHLDRYSTYSAYVASKFGIFTAQRRFDSAIMNCDDPEIMTREHLWPASRRFFFGSNLAGRAGAAIRGARVCLSGLDGPDRDRDREECYDLAGSRLDQPPNLQNSAAAILAARLMGCPARGIREGLARFSPLPHRLTRVAEINGVSYYDDSKATNIGAVHSALGSIQQPVVLIAGGRDKGGDYSLLNDLVRTRVKGLVLIGEAADSMARCFAELTRVERATTLEEAVRTATDLAEPGDAVLLSPACASFDMFTSYGHRGEVFRRAVHALPEKG
ncbi:MAG: UDP-N-acetylmuramoyl-L-alanine--D-glutamate ligase [Desulfobacterales bacterium]|nr:UDP-N-acetylmuramoyl-L-alanine--D-glutamate ligase [Desulfobacterales bacterium]